MVKRKVIQLLIVKLSLIVFSVNSHALQMESQPLRNLRIKNTQLKFNSELLKSQMLQDNKMFIQDGKVVGTLDYNQPFCYINGLVSPELISPVPEILPNFLDKDRVVDIWFTKGNYFDGFNQPIFVTEIQTTGKEIEELSVPPSIVCQRPSPMAFRELTIGEFEAILSPFVIFSKVDAEINFEPKFSSMNLDPSFIHQPEKNLFSLTGVKKAKLGLTINIDLESVPRKDDPTYQEMWYFQDGKKFAKSLDMKFEEKDCVLAIRAEGSNPLKKQTFLQAKEINGRYEKYAQSVAMEMGVPRDDRFHTEILLTTPDGKETLLMCESSDLSPINYSDSVKILGNNLIWTNFTDVP